MVTTTTISIVDIVVAGPRRGIARRPRANTVSFENVNNNDNDNSDSKSNTNIN